MENFEYNGLLDCVYSMEKRLISSNTGVEFRVTQYLINMGLRQMQPGDQKKTYFPSEIAKNRLRLSRMVHVH